MSGIDQEPIHIVNTEDTKTVEMDPPSGKLGALFEYWKLEEAQKPNPEEKIPVGTITPSDPEYAALMSAGVTQEELDRKQIPRGKMQFAGFVFNNYPIPLIEKPLINDSVGTVDYGQRKLFTSQELETILTHQRQHPELYGSETVQSDEFRQDMLNFLLTAEDFIPIDVKRKVNFLRMCIDRINKPWLTDEGESEVKADSFGIRVNPLYEQLVKLHQAYLQDESGYENPSSTQREFIEDTLTEEMPWEEPQDTTPFYPIEARDHIMQNVPLRKQKLNGMPSPFLDSGFHFPEHIGNPDFTILKKGNEGIFRVNALVLHLTSRGLSEMGDGGKGSIDQDYTLGNYIHELYPPDEATRKSQAVHEENLFSLKLSFNKEKQMRLVQKKLISLARDWAKSASANQDAKSILQHIQKIEQESEKLDVSKMQSGSWVRKILSRFLPTSK